MNLLLAWSQSDLMLVIVLVERVNSETWEVVLLFIF